MDSKLPFVFSLLVGMPSRTDFHLAVYHRKLLQKDRAKSCSFVRIEHFWKLIIFRVFASILRERRAMVVRNESTCTRRMTAVFVESVFVGVFNFGKSGAYFFFRYGNFRSLKRISSPSRLLSLRHFDLETLKRNLNSS